MEDFCGLEPVTHPPEIAETRPPLDLDRDKVKAAYHETDNALIGGRFFIFFSSRILVLAIPIEVADICWNFHEFKSKAKANVEA